MRQLTDTNPIVYNSAMIEARIPAENPSFLTSIEVKTILHSVGFFKITEEGTEIHYQKRLTRKGYPRIHLIIDTAQENIGLHLDVRPHRSHFHSPILYRHLEELADKFRKGNETKPYQTRVNLDKIGKRLLNQVLFAETDSKARTARLHGINAYVREIKRSKLRKNSRSKYLQQKYGMDPEEAWHEND